MKYAIIMWMMLCVSVVVAVPTPHGIDGRIIDGSGNLITQEVNVTIQDLNNGQLIIGKTTSGKYSAALNGNNGNTIVVVASRGNSSANRTETLNGVMHNVDITLNLGGLGGSSLSVTEAEEPIITGPKEAYIVSGVIYDEEEQISAATPITITNERTGDSVSLISGLGSLSGGYYTIVSGNTNDPITIEVLGVETKKVLQGDMRDVHIYLNLSTEQKVIDSPQEIIQKRVEAMKKERQERSEEEEEEEEAPGDAKLSTITGNSIKMLSDLPNPHFVVFVLVGVGLLIIVWRKHLK